MSSAEGPRDFGRDSDRASQDIRWAETERPPTPQPGQRMQYQSSPPPGYPPPAGVAPWPPNQSHLPSSPSGGQPQAFAVYPVPPREVPLVRRHLGAIVIAATILLVGLAGVGAWVFTSTFDRATVSNSTNSPTTSGGGVFDTATTEASSDQRFMSVLQNGGFPVTSTNQQDFITVGHNICGMLAQGYTTPPMITFLTTQKGYSSSQAATFVGASIGAYCPEFQ